MHEAIYPPLGHRREMRENDSEQIERGGNCESMKIAAAQRFAVLEHERVVGRRIQLPRYRLFDPVERIQNGAVHLRHAAERVRVLNARIAVTVGLSDRAVIEEVPEKCCRSDLSALSARGV